MSERLTTEELDAIEDQCDGFSMLLLNPAAQRDVHKMIAELRARRSRDLTAEEVEALAIARATMQGAIDVARRDFGPSINPLSLRALAVLDRLLGERKP